MWLMNVINRPRVAWLSRLSVGAVLAVALYIGTLAGPATAAAPVYMNEDGGCDNPPTSTRTVSLSTANGIFVVIDHGRSKLTEGNMTWQLINIDTGSVDFEELGPGATVGICPTGPYQIHRLFWSAGNGFLLPAALTVGTRYLLHLQNVSDGAYKNLRFSIVP
jgi:hypothetical protein